MGFSLNKIQLIGNLGKDAETTFTTSGLSITKFSVATSHSKKKQDGTYDDEATWHNIVAFGLNDFTKDGLKKGAKIYVEGRIDHQQYEKDGVVKYFTSIIANNYDGIILLNGVTLLDKTQNNTAPINDMPAPVDNEALSNVESEDSLPF